MASLNGQWKLTSVNNLDEYLEAIGVNDEMKAEIMKFLTTEKNIIEDIYIQGDEVLIKTIAPKGILETRGKVGQEFDTKALDGRSIKTVYSIDGDILVEEQSGPFTSKITRSVEGDQMIMKLVSGGVMSTQQYTRFQ